MAEINDLTIVDASNTGRFPENMAPSAVNDGARALEGILARYHRDLNGSVTTAGTGTAYTYAANQTLTAYYDGMILGVDFHAASGDSPTINVDSLGAKSIVWPDGTAVRTGEIPADAKGVIVYDGTNFQLLTTTDAGVATVVQNQSYVYGTTSGSVSYSLSLVPNPTAYAAGQKFAATITQANTGAAQLDVGGLGFKNIFHPFSLAALTGGELVANNIYQFAYDGTQFILQNPSQLTRRDIYTSDDTWTKPAGAKVVFVQAWGGGGGGGNGTNTSDAGGGGGGGGYVELVLDAASLSATVAITVGTAGSGSSVNDTSGTAGGNSTFGSYLTAYGGGGGFHSSGGGGGGGGSLEAGSTASSSSAAAGGAPHVSGGTNDPGWGGGNSSAGGVSPGQGGNTHAGGAGGGGGASSGNGGPGGASFYGGGGGGGGSATGSGGSGGVSLHGGNGGAGSTGGAAATNGTAPGGGGGGSEGGQSGNGAVGWVIVTAFISA